MTINILWMSMDPMTKVHVTGTVDMDSVGYSELRQIVPLYTNLINSTTGKNRGVGAVAMGIGSIASVNRSLGGTFIPDGVTPEEGDQGTAPVPCAVDETGWPLDEEGWPI